MLEPEPTQQREACEARFLAAKLKPVRRWLPRDWHQRIAEFYDIGFVATELEAHELAELSFRSAVELGNRKPLFKSNRVFSTLGIVAACHNQLGLIALGRGDLNQAQKCFDEAIGLREELRRQRPKDRENEVYLGGALCNRALAVKDTDPEAAVELFRRSLSVLRQPKQTCDCSYWDEQRQTWWCSQLEALGGAVGLSWVMLAPRFIDNAMQGLSTVEQAASQSN